MFNRIWKNLTLALLVVTFAPIGYFLYQNLETAKASVVDGAAKRVYLNSVVRAKDIEATFLKTHEDLDYLRANSAVMTLMAIPHEERLKSAYWVELATRELELFLNLKPRYSRVGLLDEFGDELLVVFRTGDKVVSLGETNKRNRVTSQYFVKAAEAVDYSIVAIPMRASAPSGRSMKQGALVRYATKMFDKTDMAKGVIYIDLNASEILSNLSHVSFQQSRPAAMVTHKGNYIYNPFEKSNNGEAPVPRGATLPENVSSEFGGGVSAQILSGRNGIITDAPGFIFGFSAIYPQVGSRDFFYVVFDRYSRNNFAPKLNGIMEQYLLGAVGALLLCLLVAVILSYTLTRNLSKLREGVEILGRRNLAYRLDIRSGDEIEALAEAYNMMAGSLQEYSESLEKKVDERTKHIKKVERQLMQAEKLAAIGFLGAGVAHEVNNPIAVIITRLELMAKDLEAGKLDTLKKDINVLKNHANRIGKIAGNLLTFSRDGGKDVIAASLNEVVERVMSLIEIPMRQKGLEVKTSLQDDLPPVLIDSSSMEQAIYNIVYNAYQATSPGGKIDISTTLHHSGQVKLKIKDTGQGIPADVKERIFEPFYTTKGVGEGTGLGLSITYGIVRDMGGTIEVESEPGKGTAFTITLDPATRKKAVNE